MFSGSNTAMSAILLLLGVLSSTFLKFTAAQSIGVCYGMIGGDLPSKQEVIDLYKSNGISKMRLYFPQDEAFQALRGSNIELILDVAKESLQSLTDPNSATDWINRNVLPYSQDIKFKYISVGNEIHPSDNEAQYILQAMQNIQHAISSSNLGQIKVTTTIDTGLIGKSYPPKDGAFSDDAKSYIEPIINFLGQNGSPLLVNIYPYFAYANDQEHIPLDYALFNQQWNNGVGYQNLFDAMLDSVYAALEDLGASNVQIVVSESGWPSEGGVGATPENAATYYGNLIKHANGGSGTPKRPNETIETYLFAMFDENQKKGPETERHFGLFRPDKSAKYQLSFN